MDKLDPIDIDFIINSEDVKEASNKVKGDLKSIGQTAEETAAKVNDQLTGAFGKDVPPGLAATNNALEQQGKSIQRNKPKWNGLANSMNQISREASAFAVSAQTGFLAISNNLPILADEIARVKAENEALKASGEKTVPVWKQVAKSLFSWQTLLSVGVTLLTLYGKEIINWIGSVFKGKKAIDELRLSQEALNRAFDSGSYRKAIQNIIELQSYIKLAKDGVLDKEVALKKYNDTLGEVAGEVNSLAEAEQGVIDKAPAYVEAMLYKTAAAQASAEAAKKLAESAKREQELNQDILQAEKEYQKIKNQPTVTAIGGQLIGNSSRDAAIVREQEQQRKLNELLKEREDLNKSSIKVIEQLNQKALEISKSAGLDLFGDDKTKTATISEYQKLLDKLADLDKEYTRKTFTKDEEELQALRDKFDKVRTLVQRFNADPKNKAQIIDLKNLDELQVRAEESLTYRQTTEKLKDELAEQKRLFEEFENYKATFGLEAAKKEFDGKIDTASSYYEYLKTKQKENEASYKAVQEGTAIGGEIERINLLNDALKKAGDAQQKLFNKQLASLLDYQKKRKLIIEKYEALRAKLVAKGKTAEVAELDRKHQEELDNLDDINIKKLQSYKELFNGIVGLTRKEAKIVIANAKELVKTLEMSGELKAKILKQIAEAEKLLNTSSLDNIYKFATAIGSLGNALNDLGATVGSSALSDAGSLLSGLSSNIGNVLTAFDSQASTGDKVAAGISSMVNLIGVFTSAAKRRRAAEEEYYLSVIGFQNQYNHSLQEQIRLNSILQENVFIKDYEGRVKDALASIRDANDQYEEAIDKLIKKGKVKIGQRNAVDFGSIGQAAGAGAGVGAAIGSVIPGLGTAVGAVVGGIVGAIGGLFGGKKKKDKYGSILQEYPELVERTENGVLRVNKALAESLIQNKLVKGKTKQILEDILEWEKALDEARKQIKEVIQELTGSLGSDLKTVLVDAFVSGENAALKMGDTVEKVLENIISNLVFNSIFQQAFDDLEEQMANSFDVGGDGSWIDDFSRFFDNASNLTDDFNQAMADAQAEAENFGFDIFNRNISDPRPGLTADAIRRELTEETGTEIAGLARGQYDLTNRLVEINEELKSAGLEQTSHLLSLITLNTKIEVNTGETVLELTKAVAFLETINTNTQQHYLLDLGE